MLRKRLQSIIVISGLLFSVLGFASISNALTDKYHQVIDSKGRINIVAEGPSAGNLNIGSSFETLKTNKSQGFSLAPSIQTENFSISTANGDQRVPCSAYNSKDNEYLMVWSDRRAQSTSGKNIYGQVVLATGELKGNEFPIITSTGDQWMINIAYNSVDNEYMVIWGDDPTGDIHGQRISNTGKLIGTKFVIASAVYSGYPGIAYNNKDNKYLVVWDSGNWDQNALDIYGEFISKDGTPQGNKFAICSANENQYNPWINYNNTDNEYLVVWQDERNFFDSTNIAIYGRKISNSGELKGIGDIAISSTFSLSFNQIPSIAYSSNKNEYLVSWVEGLSESSHDIKGRLITGAGATDGSIFAICSASDEQYGPFAVYNNYRKEYLVVWTDNRGSSKDIYGQRVLDSGALKESNFTFSKEIDDQEYPCVAYNSSDSSYLVAWDDARNSSTSGLDIYAQLIDTPIPPTFDLTANPTSLLSDGKATATVTATLKDASGNALTGQKVEMKVTKGNGTIGSVKDNGNGTYTAAYTASTKAGVETVTANALSMSKTVDITLIDITLDVKAEPTSLTADGKSTAVVTATLKDTSGKALSGYEAKMEVTKGKGTISKPNDNKNGTYTATYTASTQAGTETITVTLAGRSKTADITLTVPGKTRKLSIPEVTGVSGKDVVVPANIDDATGIAGGDITLTYDKNILTAKDVISKNILLTNSMNISFNVVTLGKIIISFAGATGIKSGSGELFEVTFTVSADAKNQDESPIQFDKTSIYDANLQDIPVTTQNGKVRIACVKGDINGDGIVNSKDAILALQFTVGLKTPTDQQKCAADVIADGEIKANDVIKILQMSTGQGAPIREFALAKDRTVTVTLDEIHGVSGKSVVVPIKVDKTSALAGGDISIIYDSSVLKAVDVSTDTGILLTANMAEPGNVRISFAGTQKLLSKTLAVMKFDIITDNVSPLKFKSVEIYGFDAIPLNSRNVDGRFKSWAIPAERNALMQNFPNPFNPETWIPFQLKQDSNVEIRIYTGNGQLARILNLGQKQAGFYLDKERAAYWDGKNESGELVPSGIYFYSIKSGDFNAVRKLVVLK